MGNWRDSISHGSAWKLDITRIARRPKRRVGQRRYTSAGICYFDTVERFAFRFSATPKQAGMGKRQAGTNTDAVRRQPMPSATMQAPPQEAFATEWQVPKEDATRPALQWHVRSCIAYTCPCLESVSLLLAQPSEQAMHAPGY